MEKIIRQYARLALYSGVHLQKGQILMIHADVVAASFVQIVCEEAYRCGAKEVVVRYGDEQLSRLHYLYQSSDSLTTVHPWEIESRLDYLKEGACVLHIISDTPGIFADCDPVRISNARFAYAKASEEIQRYTMNNICAWSIIAVPSPQWAMRVFPKCSCDEAMRRLWEAILNSVHIDGVQDPIAVWQKKNAAFHARVEALNACQFDMLHFTSGLGSDLYVGLVQSHRWEGGSETTRSGVEFNANMPTEEVFTMPHRSLTNGIVYASRPLDYNGTLIKDFYLRFDKGKGVDFDAKVGKDALAALLSFDENSDRLGEVALVSDDSMISRSNLLFYNTLFDENASCHLALGDSYPSCIKDGLRMERDELLKAGANQSMTHVDFMFGTNDLCVKGIRGENEILIMENGIFTERFM